MADLTFALISKIIKYDANTGKLFWLPRTPDLFKRPGDCDKWNKRYSGKEASYQRDDGYRLVTIFKKRNYVHQIVWLLFYKEWPQKIIDHISGDPSDNRIANLRLVSFQENTLNKCLDSRNTSGVHGVRWEADREKWLVRIAINGRYVNLGRFDNLEEATQVRKRAERENGYHPNHGRPYTKNGSNVKASQSEN